MIQSLITGVRRATRSWRLLLLLLAANLAFALPVVVPIFLLVQQTTSGRLMARRMLADGLDPVWLADVINEQIPGASLAETSLQTAVLFAALALGYLLLQLFLAGGIVEHFVARHATQAPERFNTRAFWAACGAHFWRFVRLALLSLLGYGAALILYRVVMRPLDAAERGASVYAPSFYRGWAALGLLLLLWMLVGAVFDYARIATVARGGRSMIKALARGGRFVLHHLLGAFGLCVLIGLLGWALFGLLAWLRAGVVQSSVFRALVALLLGQVALTMRLWARLVWYAAASDFYQRRAFAVVPEPAQPASEEAVAFSPTSAPQGQLPFDEKPMLEPPPGEHKTQ